MDPGFDVTRGPSGGTRVNTMHRTLNVISMASGQHVRGLHTVITVTNQD
jgi:hypothetical protein